jgi:hypothetical protein
MDWMNVGQDRNRWRDLVNEPSASIKCGKFLDCRRCVSFSRRPLYISKIGSDSEFYIHIYKQWVQSK